MTDNSLTFADVVRKLIAHKWRIGIITGIITCIGILYVVSLPRGYTATTKIVAEKKQGTGISSAAGMLGGLAGIGGSTGQGGITIDLTPSIIRSIPFLLEFENVQVSMYRPIDRSTPAVMALPQYLNEWQRTPWWSFSSRKSKAGAQGAPDSLRPYSLTPRRKIFLQQISSLFHVTTEKKSNVMTLSVTTQDPLVSVILVDSLAAKLQQYLTAYQIRKARQDLDQSAAIAETARQRYYQAQEDYTALMDMNKNLTSLSARAKQERAYNDMNIALQAYTSAAMQVEIARTKLLENTPVYTVLDPPVLDTSASRPNRKLIAAVSFLVGLFIAVGSVLIGDIWTAIIQKKDDPANN